MPGTHPSYPPEFRRQMVELVRSGRSPEELGSRLGMRPTAGKPTSTTANLTTECSIGPEGENLRDPNLPF